MTQHRKKVNPKRKYQEVAQTKTSNNPKKTKNDPK